MLFDVDGVLTDGTVTIHADGTESKNFGIRDGIAMVWAQRAGIKVGLLSARLSPTTPHRAAQLGITLVYQGVSEQARDVRPDPRRPDAHRRRRRLHGRRHRGSGGAGARGAVDRAGRRGRRGAVARATGSAARAAADGAARELVELVLKAQNLWDGVVASYLDEARVATPGRK